MARRWRAFDPETINREMAALPYEDFSRLRFAMYNYGRAKRTGYRVENYGEGLLMVTDAARGQGRCFFFSVRVEEGEEMLTALLVYKKEGQKVPERIMSLARRRMKESK